VCQGRRYVTPHTSRCWGPEIFRLLKFFFGSSELDSVLLTEGKLRIFVMRTRSNFDKNYGGPNYRVAEGRPPPAIFELRKGGGGKATGVCSALRAVNRPDRLK
jgi:hypothetical protein